MAVKFVIKRQTDAPAATPLAEHILDGTIATIGSDPGATVYLNDASLAAEQAVIISEDEQLLLINRADGTMLNSETLPRGARRALNRGDRLRLGAYVVELVFSQEAAETTQNPQRTLPHPVENITPRNPVSADTPSPDVSTEIPPATSTDNGDSPRKSFAAILDSLRTEEDSFYFLIEGGAHSQQRVPIVKTEMLLGWDETGKNITCETARVVAPRAVVRKDWSGVIVQAQSAGTVSVNGEPVESALRLRSGDRLTLLPTAIAGDADSHFLIFHEPASLVVLDSLLPQPLPPPVAVVKPAPQNINPTGTTLPARRTTETRAGAQGLSRKYFGYFALSELLVMAIGTLLAAVGVFLILEYI